MVHTMNIEQMAQPETSFRTTTPSTPAMTTATTTKQVDPIQVHKNTSQSEPPAHCAHVHKSTIPVCKLGELLALRKVKHPHNRRTLVNRLPLTKQDILSHYSSCFEGIDVFQGTCTNFTSNLNTSLHDMHQGKFQFTLKLHLRRKPNL